MDSEERLCCVVVVVRSGVELVWVEGDLRVEERIRMMSVYESGW